MLINDSIQNDLAETAFFKGIRPEEIPEVLTCLGAKIAGYSNDALILEEGAGIKNFGILLRGRARAFKTDVTGHVILIALICKGGEIGALLSSSPDRESPVTVKADEASAVLWIPCESLIARCKNICPRHDRLLRNYIGVVAGKGLLLHDRIDCLLKPSVREKILTCLTRLSREQGSLEIKAPFDRAAMAEYLNVDRSALSRELSRMRRDGLLNFDKNCFWLR